MSIIPKPVSLKYIGSTCTLTNKTVIFHNSKELKSTAELLQKMLSPATGYPMPVKTGYGRGISLELTQSLPGNIGNEGYILNVSSNTVKIAARTKKGIISGCQTLRQLLPVEIFETQLRSGINWKIPGVEIIDYPLFPWRGMMLDSSRSFQSVAFIKRYIDLLALHKINIFHWHLTDDQGWRLEIKAYPKLTDTGSVRGGKNPLLVPEWSQKWTPEYETYGGYYTQDEIREIVRFAEERGVDILPEIDLPGHSRAPAVSYPEILCTTQSNLRSVQGEKANVWCAGREKNYEIMEQILKEVSELFPFEYIHIGGDEVNLNIWKQCNRCNKLAKQINLNNGGELQPYVTQKLENICRKLNRKLVGWNEIMQKGISNNTCIMSWSGINPGYDAAAAGHPVVMAPGPFAYLDMAQKSGERGHFWAGIVTTEKIYSFDPLINPALTKEQLNNILGVEACLWTEFCTERPDILKKMNMDENSALIAGIKNVPAPEGFTEYQTFPRLCALAEVAWTPREKRNPDNFRKRLAQHLCRLDKLNVHYRVPTPQALVEKNSVTIIPPYPGAKIHYTTDGTAPNKNSHIYSTPFTCYDTNKLQMITAGPDKRCSLPVSGATPVPAAYWSSEEISTEPHTMQFDITQFLNKSGNWWVELIYTSGYSTLEVSKVSLFENKTLISTDSHISHICPETPDDRGRSSYKIPILNFIKNATYAIHIQAKALFNTDNNGLINVLLSNYSEPPVTFETKIPHRPEYPPSLASDWNRKTFYMTNRPVTKGENFTWRFTTPLPPAEIIIKTGNPDTVNNILTDGVLQISEDGKNFKPCKQFIYGTAETITPHSIKALRIKVTENQTAKHLTIQSPFITYLNR
jgi:hexosaminidase